MTANEEFERLCVPDVLEFFLNGAERSLNSVNLANSRNLINH